MKTNIKTRAKADFLQKEKSLLARRRCQKFYAKK